MARGGSWTLLNILAVGAGGAIGAVCRYLVGLAPLKAYDFPWNTLAVNVVGAFAIGLIAAYALKGAVADPRMLLFLKVGVCGGFTTFSAFSMDAVGMIEGGRMLAAFAYISASVILCVGAAMAAGWVAGEIIE